MSFIHSEIIADLILCYVFCLYNLSYHNSACQSPSEAAIILRFYGFGWTVAIFCECFHPGYVENVHTSPELCMSPQRYCNLGLCEWYCGPISFWTTSESCQMVSNMSASSVVLGFNIWPCSEGCHVFILSRCLSYCMIQFSWPRPCLSTSITVASFSMSCLHEFIVTCLLSQCLLSHVCCHVFVVMMIYGHA